MEPWQLDVVETARQVRDGKLSPSELVTSLLRRSEALDPQLQAWVTLDGEGALLAAKEIEARAARGEDVGLLGGVPVGLKDIFCTKGLRTTAGSKVLADYVPTEDATCVARLRQAGAIIPGKLHTAEFASSDPPPTRNAWNLAHTPGGSSSGSGAAVAAGLVPAATGSQTGGSTLRPAAYNGIVGLKPSYGLIGCTGVIPLAWSLDHVGIITRSVHDAALLLEVMAGYDPRDPASVRRRRVLYGREAEAGIRAPRIGLVRDYFLEKCTPEVRQHTEEVAQRLARAGAQVQEVSLPPSFAHVHDEHRTIITAESGAYHEARFKEKSQLYGPRIAARIREGLSMSAAVYARALHDKPANTAELEKMVAQVDVLLTPATPAPPPRDLTTTGDASFQSPWTYAGLPAIALPSGVNTAGLPLAIQLIGGRWRDARLLRVARWCEQSLDFRQHPPCWYTSKA